MSARPEAQSCSQTERRKLPRKINLAHQHTSTSPIIQKDQCTQEKPLMVSTGTSPHIPYVDYYVIPLDNCELDKSPRTPLMTQSQTRNVLFEGDSSIHCCYTSEFREVYLSLNDGEEPPPSLPRWSPEDPIPPPNEGHWGTL